MLTKIFWPKFGAFQAQIRSKIGFSANISTQTHTICLILHILFDFNDIQLLMAVFYAHQKFLAQNQGHLGPNLAQNRVFCKYFNLDSHNLTDIVLTCFLALFFFLNSNCPTVCVLSSLFVTILIFRWVHSLLTCFDYFSKSYSREEFVNIWPVTEGEGVQPDQ